MSTRKTVHIKYKGFVFEFGFVEIERFGPNLPWHIKATPAYYQFFRSITPTLHEMGYLPEDKEAVVHKVYDDCVEYGDRQIIL